MLEVATQMIFAAEPRDLSLLYFLLYAKSGAGLQRLAEIERGAQERRFTTGAQAICQRLADQLTARGANVLLDHPVHAIAQDASGITVHTPHGSLRAAVVVVAIPPSIAATIEGVPKERAALGAKLPMGSVIKCIASYDRPFWRDAGYSGEAFSTTGTVRATFDDCNAAGDHAALVAFIVGEPAKRIRDVPDDQRKTLVLAELAQLHGERARTPVAYADKDWQRDDHAGGCYVGLAAPGVLSSAGCGLRTSFGRMYFAGTETAVHHVGYLEGAIESGHRVARDIRESAYEVRAH
jgi:monoamine oxidase